jgi:hypothetical protein
VFLSCLCLHFFLRIGFSGIQNLANNIDISLELVSGFRTANFFMFLGVESFRIFIHLLLNRISIVSLLTKEAGCSKFGLRFGWSLLNYKFAEKSVYWWGRSAVWMRIRGNNEEECTEVAKVFSPSSLVVLVLMNRRIWMRCGNLHERSTKAWAVLASPS